MMISLKPDGLIFLHCFSGCMIDEIIHSLGIKKSDLFTINITRPEDRGKYRVKKLQEDLKFSELVIAIHESHRKRYNGDPISKEDMMNFLKHKKILRLGNAELGGLVRT